MNEMIDFIKKSPILFLLVALGYFAKINLENKINGAYSRIDDISKTSLGVKQSLRSKELDALIEFRSKLEYWEHHLFSGFDSISSANVTSESINSFYSKADELRLNMKVSAATLGILTQNEDIYLLAQDAAIKIAKTYEPLFRKYTAPMIDVQTAINLLENRVQLLETKNNVTREESEQIVAENKRLQQQKTELVKQFYGEYAGAAQAIIDTLVDLKIAMNDQVYRPILTDQIDEKTAAR